MADYRRRGFQPRPAEQHAVRMQTRLEASSTLDNRRFSDPVREEQIIFKLDVPVIKYYCTVASHKAPLAGTVLS